MSFECTADLGRSVFAGDLDGDGDLDVVGGGAQGGNRLYLNNDTADPFGGVSGTDITAEVNRTIAMALGDLDGDGDLDLVAGNEAAPNRLYLNNDTADSFAGVSGTDITPNWASRSRWRSATWTATEIST